MKSYDDLQRFKEKTLTNHIEFKDMSEQTRNADQANWAIIRQLMSEGAESALGNGQRTDVAAPQLAAADLFSQPAPVKIPAQASAPLSSRVAAFVTAKPAAQSGSLLESISASLKPAAARVQETASLSAVAYPQGSASPSATVGTQITASPPETARASSSIAPCPPGASLLDAVRAQPVPSGIAHPASSSVSSESVQAARFKPLFSVSGVRAAEEKALPKETLLQPLLEKIALCR
ncbi:cellulose biosynthesis protein BcsO [Erwinia sp. 198]|uniref:cellulose biosynthesis protein BcsO n=1 Tax=Erwinia sp. 198 TaxID=2022746 RepID=UPI001315329C|nr:cellulose biosynthesis protein BcsO [Erwinia sp. 198]